MANGYLFLDKKSGILMLNIDFFDLEDELKIILEKHEDVLAHLRKIRNKLEHGPHYIYEYISVNGSDLLLKTVLKYEEAENESENFLLFDLGKMIDLIIDINVLYEKIINKVLDDLSSDAYDGFIIKDLKQKFSRICFDEYNKIYDSGLLIEVGRCIYDV